MGSTNGFAKRLPFALGVLGLLTNAACTLDTPGDLVPSAPKGGPIHTIGEACVPSPEVCDGADNDCNGVADDGLEGCDRCADRLELPVVTHYTKSTGPRVDLATDGLYTTDPAEQFVAYDESKPYTPGTCLPYYRVPGYPTYDKYIADTWSTWAVPDARARELFSGLCKATQTPFRFYRPNDLDAKVLPSSGAVQVIHGVTIAGSLATLVLPTNWSKAPKKPFPIVANGYYDLNENVFKEEGPSLLQLVAESTTQGRAGAIGILWNGGGAHAARTMNENAQRQFAEVVKYVAERFSGDPNRILMYGTSRGALTALTMASNPMNLPFRVTYVAAAVPPPKVGETVFLASATFPGLLQGLVTTTGLADTWRTGFTYPSCAGNPGLTGKSGPAASLQILTGTPDPAVADAERSLLSATWLAGLKRSKTAVHLEVGSHDIVVPYITQVEYGAKLIAEGIPVEAEVMIRAGHYRRSPFQSTQAALDAYIHPARDGSDPKVTPGITYTRVDRGTKTLVPFTPTDDFFPFTMEGPRHVARGGRFPLLMVGHPGTEWEVTVTSPSGKPFVWTGTIASTFGSTQWVDVPRDQEAGEHAYTLRIKKPGGAWVTIGSNNTIDGSPAKVMVWEAEPNVGGPKIEERTRAGAIAGFGGTNWGLSEY